MMRPILGRVWACLTRPWGVAAAPWDCARHDFSIRECAVLAHPAGPCASARMVRRASSSVVSASAPPPRRMISLRAWLTTRPGKPIRWKRNAFMRFVAQRSPSTRRFIAALRFVEVVGRLLEKGRVLVKHCAVLVVVVMVLAVQSCFDVFEFGIFLAPDPSPQGLVGEIDAFGGHEGRRQPRTLGFLTAAGQSRSKLADRRVENSFQSAIKDQFGKRTALAASDAFARSISDGSRASAPATSRCDCVEP
jgi:hypothetical protein